MYINNFLSIKSIIVFFKILMIVVLVGRIFPVARKLVAGASKHPDSQ